MWTTFAYGLRIDIVWSHIINLLLQFYIDEATIAIIYIYKELYGSHTLRFFFFVLKLCQLCIYIIHFAFIMCLVFEGRDALSHRGVIFNKKQVLQKTISVNHVVMILKIQPSNTYLISWILNLTFQYFSNKCDWLLYEWLYRLLRELMIWYMNITSIYNI